MTKFNQFFPENLSSLCDSQFLDANQGEMLPAFHSILFEVFSSPILGSKNTTGQISANYLHRTCEGFVISTFAYKTWEMLPVFHPICLRLFDTLASSR